MDSLTGDILRGEGFKAIGRIEHRFRLELWWHEEAKQQVMLLPVGPNTLLKGSKSYFMRSISEEGETYARDINQLQEYLESHFPELHISFSLFRDISSTLAEHHTKRRQDAKKSSVEGPTIDDLARLQRELNRSRQGVDELSTLANIESGGSSLLTSYTSDRLAEERRTLDSKQQEYRNETEQRRLLDQLQAEYEEKGSAAAFSFTISSNVQLATTPTELKDALRIIIKELADLHRYQITQKLNGGKLNIHVQEASEPSLTWLEEWMGGALSPRQLDRLGGEFSLLKKTAHDRLMVIPRADIRVNGHVREDRKLLGARIVSTLVRRLDRADRVRRDDEKIPESSFPMRLGRRMSGDHIGRDDFVMPLAGANHMYVSGTTGSGKSYAGRVIVEEAAQHDELNILVLDPRNQSAGLLVPEDRESILAQYDQFGLTPGDAKAFRFEYHCPSQSIGAELPRDLGELGAGRVIVSFKGLDDKKRCDLFADILDGVFNAYAESESESMRLLIVIEEAHRFTKKRVDESAKSAATRAENALDRTVRESRKFGCCVVILSQTIRDFAYDTASIRQNTNTKIFMHNSDREVDYAADFIGDGKRIIRLPTATAIVCHPARRIETVRIRPPFSKVWEFGEAETRLLVEELDAGSLVVSEPARQLLKTIGDLVAERGDGVNVSVIADRAGISSKRHIQQLLDELERARLITSHRSNDRGRPRIVELIPSTSRTEPQTECGHNLDERRAV